MLGRHKFNCFEVVNNSFYCFKFIKPIDKNTNSTEQIKNKLLASVMNIKQNSPHGAKFDT